jgi:alpha/beta hydrolase fold
MRHYFTSTGSPMSSVRRGPYQHFVGQVAERATLSAFVPEYSLGPEHPFPSAVEDAQASFAGLVEHGFGRIVRASDSAGGGLALSLPSLVVAEAREGPRVRPAGASRPTQLTIPINGKKSLDIDIADSPPPPLIVMIIAFT